MACLPTWGASSTCRQQPSPLELGSLTLFEIRVSMAEVVKMGR